MRCSLSSVCNMNIGLIICGVQYAGWGGGGNILPLDKVTCTVDKDTQR